MWKIVSWMHPSYRDLIIEELASDHELRTEFLEKMSVQGIKLAISDTGGGDGSRKMPLITDSKSWDLLRQRCLQISVDGVPMDEVNLLTVVTEAVLEAHETEEAHQLRYILQDVCNSLREKWNRQEAALSATAVRSYCKASELLKPLPPLPILNSTWIATFEEFEDSLNDAKEEGRVDSRILESWTELLGVIRDNEPRFLRQVGFPQSFGNQICELSKLIEVEAGADTDDLPLDVLRDFSNHFGRLVDCLRMLVTFDACWDANVRVLLDELASAIKKLDNRADELEDPGYDDDAYDSANQEDEFDIDHLFSDL